MAEVRFPNPSGAHFDLLFDKPISLADAKELLTNIIFQLDHRWPSLRFNECKEIRPSATENTRLPLGKGYMVLLDRPADCTIHEFLDWWSSPTYIPDIGTALRELYPSLYIPPIPGSIDLRGTFADNDHAEPEQPKPMAPQKLVDRQKATVKFKGNCWQMLTAYWSGQSLTAGIYNKMLLATARVALHQGYEQEAIIEALEEFSRELPPECSSDIADGNWSEVRRRITKAVKYADDDEHQNDPAESGQKLCITAQRWMAVGSLILDKATWGRKVGYDLSDVELPDDYRQAIIAAFAPLVPKRFHAHIPAIAVRMAKLAHAKHREGNGISYPYWSEFLKDQFGIGSFAKKGLLSKLLTAAKELGIIKEAGKHIKGIKGTTYTMGSRMASVLGHEVGFYGPEPTGDDYVAVEAIWSDW